MVSRKTELLINLKKSFLEALFASVLNLVFMSIYSFNHASGLNWITLCTFSILVHDRTLVLKILCEQHRYFIIQIAYKLNAFINFHCFWQEW